VIEARRRIHAPRGALFAFLADLDQHWRLTDGVVERLGPSDGGARVVIHGPLGLRREATTRIDVATPGELAGTARVGAVTRATVSWRLDPHGETTDVVLAVRVDQAGRRDRLILALGGAAWLRSALAAALDRLEELAIRGELDVAAAA
jgi:Polyketide cyclase / dehydrase and lipid transport